MQQGTRVDMKSWLGNACKPTF